MAIFSNGENNVEETNGFSKAEKMGYEILKRFYNFTKDGFEEQDWIEPVLLKIADNHYVLNIENNDTQKGWTMLQLLFNHDDFQKESMVEFVLFAEQIVRTKQDVSRSQLDKYGNNLFPDLMTWSVSECSTVEQMDSFVNENGLMREKLINLIYKE